MAKNQAGQADGGHKEPMLDRSRYAELDGQGGVCIREESDAAYQARVARHKREEKERQRKELLERFDEKYEEAFNQALRQSEAQNGENVEFTVEAEYCGLRRRGRFRVSNVILIDWFGPTAVGWSVRRVRWRTPPKQP